MRICDFCDKKQEEEEEYYSIPRIITIKDTVLSRKAYDACEKCYEKFIERYIKLLANLND